MAVQPIVVNGRFLATTPTGLGRAARALLAHGLAAGLTAEVVAPPGTSDPLVTRTAGRLPVRMDPRAWEQLVLPRVAAGRQVLSLTNTAPLAGRNVVWVHDLAPLVGPQWFTRSMRWYGALVLRAARRAERVLTVSEQVRGELRAAGVRQPVELVRPAVGADLTAPAEPEVTAALARLGVRPPYLLFVGWTDPRKDAVTAVGAHLAAARSRDHRLVLVGLPRAIFAPVELPATPGVHVLGYVSDTDLRALLAGAAALVYPSRYEGFGLPPLEAWQCGTPALVSDLPSVREATEGRATYLPPGEVAAWAAAMVAALDGELPVPEPVRWSWHDAADRLLAAL